MSGSPDFSYIAKAYNMDFKCLCNMDNIEKEIDSILAFNGPMLIEVMIDPMDTVK